MSVKLHKGVYYVRFRPFGKQIKLALQGCDSRKQAIVIEAELTQALRSASYANLGPIARNACIKLFLNQGWEFPAELKPTKRVKPAAVLMFWDSVSLFINSPVYKSAKYPKRYSDCLTHLVGHFGKTFPMKELWTPQIREYRLKRQADGAKNATVNREVGVLSKMFGVLMDHRVIQENPCRLVERLSEKEGQREVYISQADFCRMMDQTWDWFRPILWTAYATGLRQGEVIGLERGDLDLKSRIIRLTPDRTKENKFKRIPIHRSLVPHLETALRLTSLKHRNIFLKDGKPLNKGSFKHPWRLAIKGFDQRLRFHDLRHVFHTNCRRSGIDYEVSQAIMGHCDRMRPVTERYGRISDSELVSQIDKLEFDHGSSEILVCANA
ncbi:MAG: tyrosine-type recombinase/integrase [Desulfomonilaceae bacterium]